MRIEEMSKEGLLSTYYGYEERKAELLSRLEQGENLKCCGNCKFSLSRECKYWQRYRYSRSYPALDNYCDKWTTDGMTRKEREIK